MNNQFEVIIIGGGHAGCEAAHASARMGCKTALISMDRSRIGLMSCNPAMGGLAKGQLVKEIDALGGIMGRVTDRSAIQYRRLNESKGPAVRSSRAQCDKPRYALNMQRLVSEVEGLTVIESEVSGLLVEGQNITGVQLAEGLQLSARAVVITSGTFLQAIMHTGEEKSRGGRQGDRSSDGLSGIISRLGFKLRRLKTGTPPRLHKDSIDWSKTEPQPGDLRPIGFSFYEKLNPFPFLPQINCYITHTNLQTHEIIDKNLSRSPMFSGAITGVGPRYCPSIEDKVHRFRDKERHQIFLEPEGLDVDEIYVNGISTSLPRDTQDEFVRSIVGLENARFIRYGYAVEYDAIDARQLKRTYESKDVSGLYFAGQVNGTSGYEEAGAQGLLAGINAAAKVLSKDALILGRHEAYAGVLTDDLVLKGSDEPYRMFTSRAEFRLLLREDNADLRLAEYGYNLGILSAGDFALVTEKKREIEECKLEVSTNYVFPTESTNSWFTSKGWNALKDRVSYALLLRRHEIGWAELKELGAKCNFSDKALEQVDIDIKYAGYIERDRELLELVKKNEELELPIGVDFDSVPGISNEIKAKLKQTRPETLGQTARIQGVTPAAITNLLIYLKMRQNTVHLEGSGHAK
jgi:tRNA uridine 5-carboxymethylaminomethyl modification enzyme